MREVNIIDGQDLSHDPVANKANAADPWIIQKGSLKGLHDMLSGVRYLVRWVP